jgi:hypothetical protein
MITARRHLETLRDADRERTNFLFSFVASVVALLYYENTRRRSYIDGELARLDTAASVATAEAKGAVKAEQARRERSEAGLKPREHVLAIATATAAVLAVVISVLVYHPFG